MYIRVSSLSVVRAGRKFARLPTLLAIMLVSLTLIFFVTLISDDEPKVTTEENVNYRQENGSLKNRSTSKSHEFAMPDLRNILKYWSKQTNYLKKKPSSKDDDKKKRLSELPSWRINQSLLVEDYIDLNDPHSFYLQPSGTNNALLEDDLSPYCGSDVKVLIMATSAPKNFVSRHVIRQTWGSRSNLEGKGGKLLFVLGRSDNSSLDELVAEESAKFDDIIVENFYDTYHNLTLKSVSILKWVNLTCNRNNVTQFPKYILKTDDDIFINFDRLLRVIQELPNAKMIGRLTCGAVPIGDSNSKLYMPKYLYPGRVYPGYLSGTAYLLRSDIIPILLENTKFVPLIHLEDIYVTGLLARKSLLYPEDSPFFTYNHIELKDDCAYRFMVNSHQMTPIEMQTVFSNLKRPILVPCNLKKAKWLRRVPRYNKRIRNLCLFR